MNKLDFSAEIINNKLAHSGQTEWTLLQDFTLEEDLTTDMILSPPSMKEYSEYIFGAAFNTIEPTSRNNLILFANTLYGNAHRLLEAGGVDCVPNCQGHVWQFKCSKILGVTGKDALEFCGFMRQMPKKQVLIIITPIIHLLIHSDIVMNIKVFIIYFSLMQKIHQLEPYLCLLGIGFVLDQLTKIQLRPAGDLYYMEERKYENI